LVVAIIEDGTQRVCVALGARMAAAATPQERVALLVRDVIGIAIDPTAAENLRALMWNAARTADDSKRRVANRSSLAKLLVQPMHDLGSIDPERDASSVCDTALGRLEHFLWRREAPTPDDIEHVVNFCLRAVSPAALDTKA